jgi:hypothetical protein
VTGHDAGLFTTNADGDGDAPTAGPRFADVHAFVADYLATVWARTIRDPDNAFRWCPHWHAHPVALDRLTALWRAYELLHDMAGGEDAPNRWWLDHADPTRAALCTPDGPFARCGPGRHQLPPDLPVVPLAPASSSVAA